MLAEWLQKPGKHGLAFNLSRDGPLFVHYACLINTSLLSGPSSLQSYCTKFGLAQQLSTFLQVMHTHGVSHSEITDDGLPRDPVRGQVKLWVLCAGLSELPKPEKYLK